MFTNLLKNFVNIDDNKNNIILNKIAPKTNPNFYSQYFDMEKEIEKYFREEYPNVNSIII
jgi:hypothetical protein